MNEFVCTDCLDNACCFFLDVNTHVLEACQAVYCSEGMGESDRVREVERDRERKREREREILDSLEREFRGLARERV